MFFTEIETQDVNLAMEAGHHDFEVDKVNLITTNCQWDISIPDHVAVINQNTGQYLGTVGSGWEPVQPKTIYELAQELLNATDAKINGTFTINNGSVIGISFELAEKEYIANDPIKLNFIMSTSFNGTHGIAGHSTINRLSCLNQCNTSNKIYNLRHTKNVMNRIEIVKNILKYYKNEIMSFDKKMMFMVNHSMDESEAVTWFKSLFPKAKTQRAERMQENQTSIFIECLRNGRGSEITGVRGTCYGAFQALTEYVNHHRSVKIHNDRNEDEVRFQSIHFGSGNTLTQKGLNTITSGFELPMEDFIIE